jgi:hypothetical protein
MSDKWVKHRVHHQRGTGIAESIRFIVLKLEYVLVGETFKFTAGEDFERES